MWLQCHQVSVTLTAYKVVIPIKMWLQSQARSVSPSPPTELSSPRKSAATKSSQVSVTLTAYRAVVSSVKSSYKIQPGQCHPHRLQSCRLPDKMWLQSQARSVALTAYRAGISPLKCSNKAKPGQCLSHSVHQQNSHVSQLSIIVFVWRAGVGGSLLEEGLTSPQHSVCRCQWSWRRRW